ncbi:MAG TPA: S9 family peptidase [Gaiellaceae bacterium]|nr:S9 family peptidase [Gaiellaceae bacterium]
MDPNPSQRTVAPYGTWASPISAEMVAQAGVRLSAPWIENGVVWWLEGRASEAGRVVLVRLEPGGSSEEIVPAGLNVRTAVHEYGGGAYCIHGGVAFVSSFEDQRLYRLDPGAAPIAITPDVSDRRHRYADGRITPDGALWIGVRERHAESDSSKDVVNELVAIPTDGSSEPRVIVGGRDFYSTPRISPDGVRLAFLAWNLPWMPWDGCELHAADLAPDGTVSGIQRVAGEDGVESIWQPEWSPAGDLVFVSDRSGWWNLERMHDGTRHTLHPLEAEFGYPAWSFGTRSYAFLGDGRVVCAYDSEGFTHFALLDPETGDLSPLELGLDSWGAPYVCAEGTTAVAVAGAAMLPARVERVDLATGRQETLRVSVESPVDPAYFSAPRAIEFPTEGGLTAHAFLYPPTSPDFEAPSGERPPLIVESHGGPTGNATAAFSLGRQYWTSRGFAVVDVDYGGSTGYGRAYRERLNGQWGVVDLQDCVNAARYLVEQGEVDPDRLVITGGSAGGYTTICALTFTDEFAAGATYFGIADLEQFGGGETHKFELQYEHTLVGPYPERADLYRERSPIHFTERCTTPMLVLQGTEDRIVPPSQAELIVDALRERGIPHAYLLYEGEGHGFRKAENIVGSLEAELSFYAQVLGFEPAGDIPRLELANLPPLTRRETA